MRSPLFVAGVAFASLGLVSTAAAQSQPEPSLQAQAAESSTPALSGGALFGVAFTDISGEFGVSAGSADDPDMQLVSATKAPVTTQGLSLGAYLSAQLAPRWGVRAELRYSQRGARASRELSSFGGSEEDFEIPYDITFDLAYLELPLLVTYAIPYANGFTPYLFAGPDLALLLTADVDVEVSLPARDPMDPSVITLEQSTATEDVSELIAGFDVGATLGAGMKFPLSRGHFILDARATLAITQTAGGGQVDITIPTGADSMSGDLAVALQPRNMRHRLFMLTAGYEF
ncbi:porin family protein [Haliangium ochraceum]|nr:porin family protein [Haliangium ochraceum]